MGELHGARPVAPGPGEARCNARTTRGTRCKREAAAGTEFCSIHTEAEAVPHDEGGNDRSDWSDLVIGLVAAGAVFWLIQTANRWIRWPGPRP